MGQDVRSPRGPRCIALVGPFQSGKTTLLEAILARTGAIKSAGSVDAGTSVGDASPEARHHKMGVGLSAATTTFMTNATVAQTVKGTDGQNILVKYKDGEKKVVVPPGTPIVTFVAGDKSELKPGAKIIIFGAAKKDDGTLEANRVNVGRDGITPPM